MNTTTIAIATIALTADKTGSEINEWSLLNELLRAQTILGGLNQELKQLMEELECVGDWDVVADEWRLAKNVRRWLGLVWDDVDYYVDEERTRNALADLDYLDDDEDEEDEDPYLLDDEYGSDRGPSYEPIRRDKRVSERHYNLRRDWKRFRRTQYRTVAA